MLQLTPGASFLGAAARAHLRGGLFVPPTVGDATMDAAAWAMPARLVAAARAAEEEAREKLVLAGKLPPLGASDAEAEEGEGAAARLPNMVTDLDPSADLDLASDADLASALADPSDTGPSAHRPPLAAAPMEAAAVAAVPCGGGAVDQPPCAANGTAAATGGQGGAAEEEEAAAASPPAASAQVLIEGTFRSQSHLVFEATLQRREQLNAAGAPGRRLMWGHGSIYREEAAWAEAMSDGESDYREREAGGDGYAGGASLHPFTPPPPPAPPTPASSLRPAPRFGRRLM